MSQSEGLSIFLTNPDESTAPAELRSPDPPPFDPDHVAPPVAEERDCVDKGNSGDLEKQLENLDLKEVLKGNEEQKNSNDDGGSREDGENGRNEDENESEKAEEGEELEKKRDSDGKKIQYPVRPEAEDCAYYMKTGTCKFGSNCKFNHPVRRKNQGVKEKVRDKDELVEKPGQTECKYYLRTGGCKFGNACRYNHSRAKSSATPVLELNFLGLPIRPGEKECPYYMRNGSCKYGANCKFNHPDPTTTGPSDPPSGYGNGVSVTVPSQANAQLSITPWSSPGTLNETTAYVPMVFPPAQSVPPQNPEWNGYQAPLYQPERSMHPPPVAYVMSSTETNVYTSNQPQIVVDEFPERPGQPECSYFLKTGDCKFRSNCKYHHPKNRIARSPSCTLSDKGLPLRPDQNICSHYSRYGICKFGPACKFDHSIQPASLIIPGQEGQYASFGDSAATEEAGIAGTNGTETAIQQAL